MLDAIFNAAVNWVQNNTDQAGWMAKRAYDSMAGSLRSNARRTKTVVCPHCGRRYEVDEKVYRNELKGSRVNCECAKSFFCS